MICYRASRADESGINIQEGIQENKLRRFGSEEE